MKKIILEIFLLFAFIICGAQTYDKKMKVQDLGAFDRAISITNKISIASYVTKQNIVTYTQVKKNVTDVPKFRYELMLTSNSIYNGKPTKTWIYGARVFIDSIEVTKQQFPNGFTAIIETEPTMIYWYETNSDKINIKITWESSIYFRDNK